jgi:DNA polymerase-4
MSVSRKIIHIDMDAFFASVEQRDNPKFRGKPLAVGGNSDRGVISTASYEARLYGVKSAMPSKIAKKKCPHLIFAKPNFEQYVKVSNQIKEIFFRFTDFVEPLSIDEAFLDVTENKFNIPSATIIAKKIKKLIKEETNLTASAGVSYNKFLAKIASDYNKPDGLFVIEPKTAVEFIEKLPVEKFFGVGPVTALKMHKLAIHCGLDLKKCDLEFLNRNFGKSGEYFYNISRGIDNRPVNPDRIIKSTGAERTFENDILNINEIITNIEKLAEKVFSRCSKNQNFGKTLTLKIKYSDFKQITRSKTDNFAIDSYDDIMKNALELVDSVDFSYMPVRLLGLQVSNFNNDEIWVPIQLQFDF